MTKNLPKISDRHHTTCPRHLWNTKEDTETKSKPTCSHIFQTAENKDEKKNLEDSYGKEVCIKYRRRHLRITSDISTEIMQWRRCYSDISSAKEKSPVILYPVKLFFKTEK